MSFCLPNSFDFSKLNNNSSQENDCSPKLDDPFFSDFRGILINAPKEVFFSAGVELQSFFISPKENRDGPLKIMLAGLLKLPYGTLGIDDDFKYNVLVVAVDQNTSEVFQGKMKDFGSRVPPIEISGYKEAKKELDSQENFNIDLVQNLNFPIASAKYTVYATLGEFKSNTVDIAVKVSAGSE